MLTQHRCSYVNNETPTHVRPSDRPVCLQRFYMKEAAFVLRAVSKHSPQLSQAVVGCGGVDALVTCLEQFDSAVKEGAAWALGCIARHDACKQQPDP